MVLLGIQQPYVTLFHWDTPQAIEDKYGGFLSPDIFVNGYDTGSMAPGRISTLENYPGQPKISGATEVYIVTHHLLLAHATAVKVYKEKYQTRQGGKIGITLVSHWFEPYSTSESDRMATERSLDFMLGWYVDPLTKGEYPQNMHDYVGGRLPRFSEEESKMLRGSYDFIGINYYTTYYAQNVEDVNYKNIGSWKMLVLTGQGRENGIPIGPQAGSSWLYIYPEVTMVSMSRGFFAWSFLDDFEWGSGYGSRFGLFYIDYENNLKRYAKNSVKWF
ncbi:beta-glucosidase 12-like [Populus alba]|uniref:beta-glucosidase 12-like n=1 Tax=Populus alba TaxID=43335 RepID=UPI003CC6F01B